jgi:hypothetical protein
LISFKATGLAMSDPTTISTFALAVSAASFAVSSFVAWLTFFRSGTVEMTQPTTIFFGPDGGIGDAQKPPKVFLRSLLFATSKRGRIIENMYVSLKRNETTQNFNIWTYGNGKIVRGSGIFVGETGVEANHHFLTPKEDMNFKFIEGKYTLTVYAKLLGDTASKVLLAQELEITRYIAIELQNPKAGLYFDWSPDSAHYSSHLDIYQERADPSDLLMRARL